MVVEFGAPAVEPIVDIDGAGQVPTQSEGLELTRWRVGFVKDIATPAGNRTGTIDGAHMILTRCDLDEAIFGGAGGAFIHVVGGVTGVSFVMVGVAAADHDGEEEEEEKSRAGVHGRLVMMIVRDRSRSSSHGG